MLRDEQFSIDEINMRSVRSSDEVRHSREHLREPFESMWEARNDMPKYLVTLEGLTSANDLPVKAFLHERDGTVIIGFFEDSGDSSEVGPVAIGQMNFHKVIGSIWSDEHLCCDTSDLALTIFREDLREDPTMQKLHNIVRNDSISVEPDHMGRGLGSALIDLGMMCAEKLGYTSMQFDALSEAGIGIIRHVGYPVETKSDTYDYPCLVVDASV